MKKLIVLLVLLVMLPAQGAFLPPVYEQKFEGILSENLGESLEVVNYGFSTMSFDIIVPTGGAIIVEGLIGDAWESALMRSLDNDTVTSVVTVDGQYIGSVISLSTVRFRTSTGGSAPGEISITFSRYVSVLEGIEHGWAPHKFGHEPIHVDASYGTAQTGTVLFAADADKQSVVTDLYFTVSGSTDCIVTIFDETNSSGNRIFYGAIEVATNKNFAFDHSYKTPYVASAKGNSWKLTTSAACQIDIVGHGYQY